MALNASLPARCILCTAASGTSGLCAACYADLPWLSPTTHCPVCALATLQGEVCGECLRNPPAFYQTTAALPYRWPIDQLVQALKYQSDIALARPLGSWLGHAVVESEKPDCLIAMPLHTQRQQERGFNQSVLLARQVHTITGIPLRLDIAQRCRYTQPQAQLPWRDRHKLIRGAFAVDQDLTGLHIAIVDDVMTTGASLNELARTLVSAGARRVDCWVLARTMKHDT